jgi:hypothetical protein
MDQSNVGVGLSEKAASLSLLRVLPAQKVMDRERIFRERVSCSRPPLFVFYQWIGRLSHASRGYNSLRSRRAVSHHSKFQRRALEHVFGRPSCAIGSRESRPGEKASCNGRAVIKGATTPHRGLVRRPVFISRPFRPALAKQPGGNQTSLGRSVGRPAGSATARSRH